MFGGDFVKIKLVGDTFDASKMPQLIYSEKNGAAFIHPFDDPQIIEGQSNFSNGNFRTNQRKD